LINGHSQKYFNISSIFYSNENVEDKYFTVKICGIIKENEVESFNISIPKIRVELVDGQPAINFNVDDMSLDCEDQNLKNYLQKQPDQFHEWVLEICKNL